PPPFVQPAPSRVPAFIQAPSFLPPRQRPSVVPPVRPSFDLEQVLGANWLAKLGIAAIAVGMGFFLQYAFGKGWIGPAAQVAIGLGASGVMLAAAQFLL